MVSPLPKMMKERGQFEEEKRELKSGQVLFESLLHNEVERQSRILDTGVCPSEERPGLKIYIGIVNT